MSEIYEDRTVIGLYEPILIKGNNGKKKWVIARIDSGATKSSIDEKLVEDLDLGPVLRNRMTKQASGVTWRPVIKVHCELGGRKFYYQFTISDRKEMKYKVLVGQNIIKRNFLIDPLREREKIFRKGKKND